MKRLWRDGLLTGTLPADASTPLGRSRERFRRIGLTTASSIAARGIGFATSLITVPLTLIDRTVALPTTNCVQLSDHCAARCE